VPGELVLGDSRNWSYPARAIHFKLGPVVNSLGAPDEKVP
jgi:hypothetical protein